MKIGETNILINLCFIINKLLMMHIDHICKKIVIIHIILIIATKAKIKFIRNYDMILYDMHKYLYYYYISVFMKIYMSIYE